MVLWFNDGYVSYAYCILAISLWGVFDNLYETITNIARIRKLALYSCKIEVKRDGSLGEMSSDDLVPGDVVRVPENTIMPCDMILLTGTCIVNESMLTGESIPVIKQSIAPTRQIYDSGDFEKSKKHTLYSGTKVIQTRQAGD